MAEASMEDRLWRAANLAEDLAQLARVVAEKREEMRRLLSDVDRKHWDHLIDELDEDSMDCLACDLGNLAQGEDDG